MRVALLAVMVLAAFAVVNAETFYKEEFDSQWMTETPDRTGAAPEGKGRIASTNTTQTTIRGSELQNLATVRASSSVAGFDASIDREIGVGFAAPATQRAQ